MSTVTLVIDNQQVQIEAEATILQAARAAGIAIPTLCNDPRLEPYGACRLCMVEIVKNGRAKLVASCLYPVEDGLVVNTHTEKVLKIRRMIVELLWPQLEDLAREYGLEKSRFQPEHTDCSLCGRCVRYCAEVKNRQAVYFKGRGVKRTIALVPELASECHQCKECFGQCSGGLIVKELDSVYV